MRVLGVNGSLQANSKNLALLQAAARLAPPHVTFELFDGIRELPHFDPDLEANGTLAVVDRWREALSRSDALLITCPEYGHSLPGALKNAIDWVIGSGELERKVVAITAAVPAVERGQRGLNALAGTLAAVSARLVGGFPIARGPDFERDLAELLRALVHEAAKPSEP